MQSEKLFDQAVQLAAAFVANGDIRLQGRTDARGQAQEMLGELIASLYETLCIVHGSVVDPSRFEPTHTPDTPQSL